MNSGIRPDPGRLPFRRIIDAPLQTCLAAIENGQRTQPDGQLRIGHSRIHGPIKHDRDSGTHQIQVRLARGPLRPLLRMRLNLDRWSPTTTALELIPSGRIRPTAAYFRACRPPARHAGPHPATAITRRSFPRGPRADRAGGDRRGSTGWDGCDPGGRDQGGVSDFRHGVPRGKVNR